MQVLLVSYFHSSCIHPVMNLYVQNIITYFCLLSENLPKIKNKHFCLNCPVIVHNLTFSPQTIRMFILKWKVKVEQSMIQTLSFFSFLLMTLTENRKKKLHKHLRGRRWHL